MTAVEVDAIAVGRVLDEGRGRLPYSLVHGEALVTTATWALAEAGVLGELEVPHDGDDGLPLVLHDSLCPMTPPAFIVECVHRAVRDGAAVAAVRPVTDTVKTVSGDIVGATVDRDALALVVSPVVVPAAMVGVLGELLAGPAVDLASLVVTLREVGDVELVEAPAEAMRVSGPEDVRLLEALTRPG